MKIKVTYSPGEEWIVAGLKAFINHLCPGTKVRKSEAHPPFKHIYLTIIKPANPCNSKEIY